MKNVLFTLMLTLNFGTNYAISQDCSDLFITEIVFSKQGSNLSGGSIFYNHSVEVFNPTNTAVDLSDYQIALVPNKSKR